VTKATALGGKGVDKKQIEGRAGDQRFDDDFARAEPILDLAAVQQDLKCADGQAESAEAEPVEFLRSTPRAFRQKHHHAKKGDDPQRDVDVEHIAPRVIFSEPAAEHGAEHGTDDNTKAEQRHRESMALFRVNRKQDRL
jgi:hypothetical protein